MRALLFTITLIGCGTKNAVPIESATESMVVQEGSVPPRIFKFSCRTEILEFFFQRNIDSSEILLVSLTFSELKAKSITKNFPIGNPFDGTIIMEFSDKEKYTVEYTDETVRLDGSAVECI